MNKDYSSRILRIGLVNSGMFDLLELNLDVRAIHFIAANNVGKTSLIELIQFLYFHDAREMTFSKSTTESLAFYFRPEGSYILFEVRTLDGTIRTVGIYGEGTADSRTIFVFDGMIELDTFLDDEQRPLRLNDVQPRLFKWRYSRFTRFEDYERALLGEHPDARFNVRLFDLSRTNFRLLRTVLRGLLRLDRLTSRDAQEFIIKIVETEAVKTSINIAQDFERKHREIQGIRSQLTDLQILRPTIEEWQRRSQLIAELEAELAERQAALYHTSHRYLEQLRQQEAQAQRSYDAGEQEIAALTDKQTRLLQQRADQNAEEQHLERLLWEWQEVEAFCRQYSRTHLRADQDRLFRQRLDLEETLRTIQPDNLPGLHKRRRDLQAKAQRLQRQMAQQTLEQLWHEAGFSEPELALLKFLASEQLYGLSAGAAADPERFLHLSRQAVSHLDADGTFRGGGLLIKRAEWYLPEAEQEPLPDQLARIEKEMAELEEKIVVAEDRQRAEAELRRLHHRLDEVARNLRRFERLDELQQEHGALAKVQSRRDEVVANRQRLDEALQAVAQERARLEREKERAYARLDRVRQQIRDAAQEHQQIPPVSTPCPPEVAAVPAEGLAEEYRLAKDRVERRERDLRREREELRQPQQELEKRYERESPDMTFAAWVANRLNIAQEIARIEALLEENYNGLFTQVRGELNNLTQAYETVKNRVAALNNLIRRVSVSNIEQIGIELEESDLVAAVQQTTQPQMGLFERPRLTAEEGERFVEEYLNNLRNYGQELRLADMFQLAFLITFEHNSKPVREFEINRFESNGTRIAIKIVLYLGLIKLLQQDRRAPSARIPFFLDEVGSIDSHNLGQLLRYCEVNNFLPIFASPEIRPDIPHNYIFKRDGARSYLESEIVLTPLAPSGTSSTKGVELALQAVEAVEEEA